jgi:hypothetical protein
MSEELIWKISSILISASVFGVGLYCIYAAIRKKTVADPDDPNNVLPFPYYKIPGVLKPLLVIVGITFSLGGFWLLCVVFFEWF